VPANRDFTGRYRGQGGKHIAVRRTVGRRAQQGRSGLVKNHRFGAMRQDRDGLAAALAAAL